MATGPPARRPATVADPLGVSIAFGAAWDVADPVWTRIDTLEGARVRDWSIDRGRPNEFAKTGTGTATVRIVDRQGLFDPTNATSPYVGKITPGRQAAVSLQNPIGDSWHTLFRGYVESWSYELAKTREWMELELQLVDGFAIFARRELRVGVDGLLPLPAAIAKGNVAYGETLGPVRDRILAIIGDVGWPLALAVVDVDLFSGNVRVGPKAYGAGASALDALWDAADAEFVGVANLWMSKTGHLCFRGRQARFRPDVAEYQIARRTIGDPSVTATDNTIVPVSELAWTNGYDNLYNACSATPQGVGTGTSWRPLDPSVDDVAGQYVVDQVSVDAYGPAGLTFDNLQTIEGLATGNGALAETRLMAEYYVDNYAHPLDRISRMVFKSRRPGDRLGPALWAHLCNAEISDLLMLRTAHPGGGGFFQEFYVEGLHYTGRPGAPGVPIIELTLDVSPRAHYTSNPFDSDPDPTPP